MTTLDPAAFAPAPSAAALALRNFARQARSVLRSFGGALAAQAWRQALVGTAAVAVLGGLAGYGLRVGGQIDVQGGPQLIAPQSPPRVEPAAPESTWSTVGYVGAPEPSYVYGTDRLKPVVYEEPPAPYTPSAQDYATTATDRSAPREAEQSLDARSAVSADDDRAAANTELTVLPVALDSALSRD